MTLGLNNGLHWLCKLKRMGLNMIRTFKLVALALLIIIGLSSLISMPSFAAAQDYRFELVNPTVHAGHNVSVSIRLIQTSTGKAVTGAVIKSKLNMLMSGMAPMPSSSKTLGGDSGGQYQISCNVSEPGDWMLDLSAQVPSKKEPITGTLKFQVVK